MPKIVVPTDFSDNALHAAVCAAGIAAKCGAVVYLLHAMDAATDPILETVALDTAFMEKYTREEFDRLRSVRQRISELCPNLPIELRLSKGLAVDAILSFSQTEQADLIIMGAHGSGRMKEVLIGSVTSEIIARTGGEISGSELAPEPLSGSIVMLINYRRPAPPVRGISSAIRPGGLPWLPAGIVGS